MVLCSRCRMSVPEVNIVSCYCCQRVQPCAIREGEPCSLCKEDMELEIEFQALRNRRRNLRTRMNAAHDPFVLKVPPEIASHILSLSIQANDDKPHCGLKKLPTSLLLGSVCRGWRRLVRSTPQLWSTLSFTLGKPTKMGALDQLLAIKDWLELSGGLPLGLWVYFTFGIYPVSKEKYGPVIDTLNQHSGRWLRVCLYLPAPFFSLFCGTSPPRNLRDIQLTNQTVLDSPIFRMSSSPSPANLVMNGLALLAIDIFWDNLTTLTLKRVSFDGLIEVIRRAPLLKILSILDDFHRVFQPLPCAIVKHTRLRTLEFYSVSVEPLSTFLDAMELPSLEEYTDEAVGDIATDSIISLLNRSGSCLKKLTFVLYAGPTTDLQLKELLYAVPSLQHLELNSWDSNNILGDLIFRELSSSPPFLEGSVCGFLPHLQSLSLCPNYLDVSTWKLILHIFSWPHRKLLCISRHRD